MRAQTPALQAVPLGAAALPVLAWALERLAEFSVFSALRPFCDWLTLVFFVGPMLFYDAVGLIRFNVLSSRPPELAGSAILAQLIYVSTSSLLLFAVASAAVAVVGRWRSR